MSHAKIQGTTARCDILDVEIKEVLIPNPNVKVRVDGWVNAGYTKLHVFNMTSYEKVTY